MAVGRSFPESLQKALRSLETGLNGLSPTPSPDAEDGDLINTLKCWISGQTPDRILRIAQAMRLGMSVEEIHQTTFWDKWFLNQIAEIISAEAYLNDTGLPADTATLHKIKSLGFSDNRIAELCNLTEEEVGSALLALGITPIYKRIDTCAA